MPNQSKNILQVIIWTGRVCSNVAPPVELHISALPGDGVPGPWDPCPDAPQPQEDCVPHGGAGGRGGAGPGPGGGSRPSSDIGTPLW